MTRLLTCGWETGNVDEAGVSVLAGGMFMTAVSSGPTPRSGGYCLKIGPTGNTVAATYKLFLLAAPKTELWVRWAIYVHPIITSDWAFARLNDPSGADQATLTWSPLTGVLSVRNGSASGTIVGSAGVPMTVDAWHVLEWRWQVLTATTGNTELWLDGNRVINFSGDVANSAVLSAQNFQLGQLGTIGSSTGAYVAYDDIAINDVSGSLNNGRPGDGRIVLLSPTGAGSSTTLVRGGTDTGANWSQTSELPPSMVQYVGSSTPGDRDLYTLSDLGVAVAGINCVEAVVVAQNSDPGGGFIAPTIKSGATINEATAIGLPASAVQVGARWETDPNTGAAWTAAAVNALEGGVTVR